MYSVLKTLKTSITHHKHTPPSDCIFLTDMHILLTFQDACFQIYHLQLSNASNHVLLY